MSADSIVVRAMGNDDAEPVALLLAKLYNEMGISSPMDGHHLTDRLRELGTGASPKFFALVAFYKARACGLLMYSSTFDPVFAGMGGYVSALYVSENTRGSGVGKAMVTKLAQIALRSHWTHLEWSTKLAQRSSAPFVEQYFSDYHKAHARVLFGGDLQSWAKQTLVLQNNSTGNGGGMGLRA